MTNIYSGYCDPCLNGFANVDVDGIDYTLLPLDQVLSLVSRIHDGHTMLCFGVYLFLIRQVTYTFQINLMQVNTSITSSRYTLLETKLAQY